jgi:NTE family protein
MRKRFEQLELPLYVGATDLLKGKFMLYNSWELLKPVLWSLALPWIFAPIEYEGALLVDWWITNNFPIDVARKGYPKCKHIWILLSKFKKNQKIWNLIDTLQVTYDLLLRGHLSQSFDQADILFYRDLKTGTVESNEKKLRHLFELWYQDGLEAFSS